jgi:hypothetical protein
MSARRVSLCTTLLVVALVASACYGSSGDTESSESEDSPVETTQTVATIASDEQAALDAFESATTTVVPITIGPASNDPCVGEFAEVANAFGFCELRTQILSGALTPQYPDYCKVALDVPRLVYNRALTVDPAAVDEAVVFFALLSPVAPEALKIHADRLLTTATALADLLRRQSAGELTDEQLGVELIQFADMESTLREWIGYTMVGCSAGTIAAEDVNLAPLPGLVG